MCESELTEFFLQNSPSLPQNAVRLSEFSSPKAHSTLETVFRPFPNYAPLKRSCGAVHIRVGLELAAQEARAMLQSLSANIVLGTMLMVASTRATTTTAAITARALVAPYRAILRYYRCDTPYRAIPFKGG